MVFSDTTNKDGLIQMCEDLTSLGDANISGNTTLLRKFTAKINRRAQEMLTMILESRDDWDFDDVNNTDYAIATTPMVANQRDYSFPASLKLIKIKRVDITYDGTNWNEAQSIESSDIVGGLGNDTTVDSRFSADRPYYDMNSNALFVYPRANSSQVAVGATIRIEFTRDVGSFAYNDTTDAPGFDLPFHQMLAIGASLDYAIENDKATKIQTLSALWVDWAEKLRHHYGSKDEGAQYVVSPEYVSYR